MRMVDPLDANYGAHPLVPAPAPKPPTVAPASVPKALVPPPATYMPEPSPTKVTPTAPKSVPQSLTPPSAAPKPSPKAPSAAPAGSLPAAPSSAVTNPGTGQVAPAVGSPTGYDITQGIDTSSEALLPGDFDLSDLQDGHLPDATTPGSQAAIDKALANQQGPTDWDVTPEQTVAGQYNNLMAEGSPLLEAAREKAIRANAAGGGRNNLMAQTAGSLAASQVAIQVAQQDAQTNAAAGQFNAAAANDFAKQMNDMIDNSTLSEQNFLQGVATLKDQTNANLEQLYAQVVAGAATQSVNLNATLKNLQAQTNATMEQMDKTFSQDMAKLGAQNSFANEQAWTNFGMQVRTSYLASVNQQQLGLMQTIAEIRSNPNINTSQANAAITDAVDQFNSFMTMNNAYYSAMAPEAGVNTSSSANNPAANYTFINADNWPNP